MSFARTISLPAATREHGLLHDLADLLRQFFVAAFNPYRPEQHYMRGPGPACRARGRIAS